ncbi:hypothetical protein [Streptococcus himalayensis]|uniref:Uncharacterized protein n=1 Tax=Streptococcus himalayensis TaxID=1888195 RepID=A0A917A364_9STRE|nr:hypothetical protein [Streptococcus himalayensis]GGE23514.1 hypothetical protein GCM10011510_00700 [Streptococcus himalayensis]
MHTKSWQKYLVLLLIWILARRIWFALSHGDVLFDWLGDWAIPMIAGVSYGLYKLIQSKKGTR